jgi:hypothetical protein
MTRRMFLAALVLCAALSPGTALASYEDELVRRLEQQGYSEIVVSRTFLGRTRILATSPNGTRELILNPKTGEILRDLWTDTNGRTLPAPLSDGSGGNSGSGSSGGGSGDGGDDGGGDDGESGGDDGDGGDDDDGGHDDHSGDGGSGGDDPDDGDDD